MSIPEPSRVSVTRGHVHRIVIFNGNSGAMITVRASKNDGSDRDLYYSFKTFNRELADRFISENWGPGDAVKIVAGDKSPGGKKAGGGYYQDSELIAEITRTRKTGDRVTPESLMGLLKDR